MRGGQGSQATMYTWRSEDDLHRSLICSSTLCILGIELWSSDLVARILITELSHWWLFILFFNLYNYKLNLYNSI